MSGATNKGTTGGVDNAEWLGHVDYVESDFGRLGVTRVARYRELQKDNEIGGLSMVLSRTTSRQLWQPESKVSPGVRITVHPTVVMNVEGLLEVMESAVESALLILTRAGPLRYGTNVVIRACPSLQFWWNFIENHI